MALVLSAAPLVAGWNAELSPGLPPSGDCAEPKGSFSLAEECLASSKCINGLLGSWGGRGREEECRLMLQNGKGGGEGGACLNCILIQIFCQARLKPNEAEVAAVAWLDRPTLECIAATEDGAEDGALGLGKGEPSTVR